MSNLNGFNRIGASYDFLKRLVFGSAISRSKVSFLYALPRSGNFLVLGGGTGEILKPLLLECPAARIWYIDASSVMLAKAQCQASTESASRIVFIHGTEESIPPDIGFDCVITQFFLDLFPDKELQTICGSLAARLNHNGVWLVSDFINGGRWWHRVLLWCMYRFFVATAKIAATRLPDWEAVMRTSGLDPWKATLYFGGFIRSCVYKRAVGKFAQ